MLLPEFIVCFCVFALLILELIINNFMYRKSIEHNEADDASGEATYDQLKNAHDIILYFAGAGMLYLLIRLARI